jgi:hypothetical protein
MGFCTGLSVFSPLVLLDGVPGAGERSGAVSRGTCGTPRSTFLRCGALVSVRFYS